MTFSASYVASTVEAPALAEIDIDGVAYTLEQEGTSASYTYSTNELSTGAHYYRFRFSDGSTLGVYEDNVTQIIVPFTLTKGTVFPGKGTTSTTYDFTVEYTHSDDLSPQSGLLYVDGVPYAMSLKSGSPRTGASYSISISLDAGEHSYFFVFNDGQASPKTSDPRRGVPVLRGGFGSTRLHRNPGALTNVPEGSSSRRRRG